MAVDKENVDWRRFSHKEGKEAFLSIKTWEVTVYIFITLFLLVIVWKRDAPSIMLLREILYS